MELVWDWSRLTCESELSGFSAETLVSAFQSRQLFMCVTLSKSFNLSGAHFLINETSFQQPQG